MPKSKVKSSSKTTSKTQAAPIKTTVTTIKSAATTRARFASWQADITPGTLLTELLGTFFLAAAVLTASNNALVGGITLLVLVVILGGLSGGNFNPAVTLGLLAARKMPWMRAVGYVVAQVLGAMLALVVVSKFVKVGAPMIDANGLPITQAFSVKLNEGNWEPFFAELLGGTLLGLAYNYIVSFKKQGIDAGIAAGLGYFVGLVIATLGSVAILNPAVALSIGAYVNGWGWLGYALGPIAGAAIGAWLYNFIRWDLDSRVKKAM